MTDVPVDPRVALFWFAVATLLLVAIAWPRHGLAARLRRLLRMTERTRVEDAIKHLYHAGERGEVVTDGALATSLQMGRARAHDLLGRLAARGLAESHDGGHRLTTSGRRDALRVVRSHRLLERYLADRTGIGPEEWHEVAEEQEHALTPEEVEALAAAMGQPRFDPHGDPIPTASGELPGDDGVSLTTLDVGDSAVVRHLEDEPRAAYDQTRALGLALGMPLVVRARDTSAVTVAFDGRTVTLPLSCALAVTVARCSPTDTARLPTLADIRPGQSARVRAISSRCQGAQRRRLLDLGVVPGTEIVAELDSASGDPMAYRIRGALIALRRQQAEWIVIEADVRSGEVAA
jgi:DtxR family transcriptional regulator, Mn-dependent transcriptional regulator